MEADFAAEHFDCGLEQDYGGGAVDVVVAVEKDRLMLRDGLLKAGDGCVHAKHLHGVVEMGEFGVEEGEGLVGVRDAASDEQLGKDMRQMSGFGQFCGCFRMRLCEDPTLIGTAILLRSGYLR
jgi:hypothetical protein